MRTSAQLLAFLLLATIPSAGGAQAFQGRVFDGESDLPLNAVDIFLLDSADVRVAVTFTDTAGLFRLSAPGPGAWRIGAELLGHGPVRSELLEIGEDETKEVEIRMAVAPIEIEEPVVVVATRRRGSPDLEAFWRRVERGEASGFGDFIYGPELERASMYPSDVLRGIPGVYIVTHRTGFGQVVMMRGGCEPALYVDGTQLNRMRRGESLDAYVSLVDIEGIEVYKGSEGPGGRYYDQSGCGLVMVWTRRGEPGPGGPFQWRRFIIGTALILGVFLMR